MLKIIKLGPKSSHRVRLIEAISNATNRQTKVDEADRRSNTEVFKEIQLRLFHDYGYFFERKHGEFHNGKDRGLLADEYVIDRFNFLKAYLALSGDPSSCRSKGERSLFRHDFFKKLFPDEGVSVAALFAYRVLCCVALEEKAEKKNHFGSAKYGNALRYGRFAVVAAVGRIAPSLTGKEDFDAVAQKWVNAVLSKWKQFENRVKHKVANRDYFAGGEEGFDNYYKGKTLNNDIKSFFLPES